MPDFSCYVSILNNSTSTLTLAKTIDNHGQYVVNPPQSIPPGGYTSFQITLTFGYGPDGGCVYSGSDQNGVPVQFTFTYACPTTSDNAADVQKSGNGQLYAQMIPNPLPTGGHPVYVEYIVINV